MIHQLKTEHNYFEEVLSGRKTFEVRFDDRGFRVGDFLALNELAPLPLPPESEHPETGRCCLVEIAYILRGHRSLQIGYVILGIRPCGISATKSIDFRRGDYNYYAVPCYGTAEYQESQP